ncbi:hypothetical protein BGX38DRAFT_1268251 [Terfezia claveryi]|nr:hypothetical protein BGX38DRAFT_1268251 [Terfezia claveryi]
MPRKKAASRPVANSDSLIDDSEIMTSTPTKTPKGRGRAVVSITPDTPTPTRAIRYKRKSQQEEEEDTEAADKSLECVGISEDLSDGEVFPVEQTPRKTNRMPPSAPVPPMKRAKRESLPILKDIYFIEPHFKEWIEEAAKLGEVELNHAINFQVRLMCWKKLDHTPKDRSRVSQAAWGIPEKQLVDAEKEESVSHEPLGIAVFKQWRKYYKGILVKIRENTECLMKMFFESDGAKACLDSFFLQVETRGAKSINDNYPCLEPEDIEAMFLKGNLELVSDFWSFLLDVVDADFICVNPFWAGRFQKATATIVAWMLTFHLKLENPRHRAANFVPFTEVYKAELLSNAILKADAVLKGVESTGLVDWPQIKKPESWSKRRSPVNIYGALKYAGLRKQAAQAALEEDIEEQLERPEIRLTVPAQPKGVPDLFYVTPFNDRCKWLIETHKARATALRNLSIEAGERIKNLEEEAGRMENRMVDEFAFYEKAQKGKEMELACARFMADAKKMFSEALEREREACIEKRKIGDDKPSVLEILGSFAAWVGVMRKEVQNAYSQNAYGQVNVYGATGQFQHGNAGPGPGNHPGPGNQGHGYPFNFYQPGMMYPPQMVSNGFGMQGRAMSSGTGQITAGVQQVGHLGAVMQVQPVQELQASGALGQDVVRANSVASGTPTVESSPQPSNSPSATASPTRAEIAE